MRFYTTVNIGDTRALTPEGFLICKNVPIARTGEMLYAEHEIGLSGDERGIVRVTRDAEDVFDEKTIASFEGKPITIDHPDDLEVNPENWKELSVGVVQNVRRGKDADEDKLFADLIVQDAKAIKLVDGGLREVSCGYDAEYEQIENGRGRQFNIVGNHVALVKSGRCGNSCKIGDSKMKKKLSWGDKLKRALAFGDENTVNELVNQIPEGEDVPTKDDDETEKGHTININLNGAKSDDVKLPTEPTVDDDEDTDPMEKIIAILEALSNRLDKLEGSTTDDDEELDDQEDYGNIDDTESTGDDDLETPPEGNYDIEQGAKTGDSVSLLRSWQDLRSKAEIISSGFRMPTFDAKAKRSKTIDSMCQVRKQVLGRALKVGDSADVIKGIAGGTPNVPKMTCDAAAILFNQTAREMSAKNNNKRTGDAKHSFNKLDTKAQNTAFAEFWKNK